MLLTPRQHVQPNQALLRSDSDAELDPKIPIWKGFLQ